MTNGRDELMRESKGTLQAGVSVALAQSAQPEPTGMEAANPNDLEDRRRDPDKDWLGRGFRAILDWLKSCGFCGQGGVPIDVKAAPRSHG